LAHPVAFRYDFTIDTFDVEALSETDIRLTPFTYHNLPRFFANITKIFFV
jgi:hypothetical protein